MKYGKQKTYDSELDLGEAIRNSNSIKALDQLREAVAKCMTPSILKLWQDRYKYCSRCAKIERLNK